MYHSYNAKHRHDKVFALLGMSSDDIRGAQLEPDYNVSWKLLMERVVQFLLGPQVDVHASDDKELALIKSKGFAFGDVLSKSSATDSTGRQRIDVVIKVHPKHSRRPTFVKSSWTLKPPANPINEGDIVCLFEGAPYPSVVRPYKDHFAIIAVLIWPPSSIDTDLPWDEFRESIRYTRDFLLVWDWETPSQNSDSTQNLEDLDDVVQKSFKVDLDSRLENANRTLDTAFVLEDLELCFEADKRFRAAIGVHRELLGDGYAIRLKTKYRNTPLSLAARNECCYTVDLLIAQGGLDLGSPDSSVQTVLLHAIEKGGDKVVRQLLATDQICAEGQVEAFALAVKHGRDKVFQQLLAMGQIPFQDQEAAISVAVGNGRERIVRQLLISGSLNGHALEQALYAAAIAGQSGTMKQLLVADHVDFSDKGSLSEVGGRTLWAAARYGHEVIVNQLLAAGPIDINWKDNSGQSALIVATDYGHEDVVKHLLATGKVDVATVDHEGNDAMTLAIKNHHDGIVYMLRNHSDLYGLGL